MLYGIRHTVYGTRYMVYDIRYMVYSNRAYGTWYMVYGEWARGQAEGKTFWPLSLLSKGFEGAIIMSWGPGQKSETGASTGPHDFNTSYTLRRWGVTWCYIGRFVRDIFKQTCNTSPPQGVTQSDGREYLDMLMHTLRLALAGMQSRAERGHATTCWNLGASTNNSHHDLSTGLKRETDNWMSM